MARCQFGDKAKVDGPCKVLAQEGSAFCPRHTFLTNVKAEELAKKADAKDEAKEAGIKGHLPRNRVELMARGYHFIGEGHCAGCNQAIEWWNTPAGRKAPFEPMPHHDSPAATHFIRCKLASVYRRAS